MDKARSEKICLQVCELSKEVGAFIREERNKISQQHVEVKSTNSFVTYVDKTAEKKIVDALLKILPGSGFITEEETTEPHKGEEFLWVIDPLDGTTNFIHGLPCFSVSIGLLQNNIPVMGVIYEVNMDECFYAWGNGKAYMNGKEIRVSSAKKVKDSLIATGFPYYDYERMDDYMSLLKYLMTGSRGLRRIGSAAVDLAYVACGRFEVFYEYSLNPWDVAAGVFIVQQAGGRVTDFSGGNNFIFGKEIVAGNSFVHDEFMGVVTKFFNKKLPRRLKDTKK